MASAILRVEDIVRLIEADGWRMRILQAVSTIALPDCWIGAGFVRNLVWDVLHDFPEPTPLNDVDVLYFDKRDIGRENERRHESVLARAMPGVPWSVRNQARMHLRNGDAPYRSVADAMLYWAETATSVAVRRNPAGGLELIAAHGIGDLVDLVVRPTPRFAGKIHVYRARMQEKNWPAIWPRLNVHELSMRMP